MYFHGHPVWGDHFFLHQQKVMQLKSFKFEIEPLIKSGKEEDLANKLSIIKNNKLLFDYDGIKSETRATRRKKKV